MVWFQKRTIKRGSIYPETFMPRACFPNVSQFPIRETCFQCQFLFSIIFLRCELCLRYTGGNFNENTNMRAVVKILRERASEHASISCEQFEQRPNFASSFNSDGTFRCPYCVLSLVPSSFMFSEILLIHYF